MPPAPPGSGALRLGRGKRRDDGRKWASREHNARAEAKHGVVATLRELQRQQHRQRAQGRGQRGNRAADQGTRHSRVIDRERAHHFSQQHSRAGEDYGEAQ